MTHMTGKLQGKSQVGKLKLPEDNLILVVCAFRDLSNIGTPPQNTIVLGKESLKQLYTPTLSSRPQFILPEASISQNLGIPSKAAQFQVQPSDDELRKIYLDHCKLTQKMFCENYKVSAHHFSNWKRGLVSKSAKCSAAVLRWAQEEGHVNMNKCNSVQDDM